MAYPGSVRASIKRASTPGALFLWFPLTAILILTAAILSLASTPVTAGQAVEVFKVIDGDTVILADKRHVRLIGINTPEIGKKGRPDQPLARQAKQYLETLIRKGNLSLTIGQQDQDRHRRTLAYLDAGSTDVQQAMLAEGLAWLVAIPPNTGRLKQYIESQSQARQNKKGVWSHRFYRPRQASELTVRDTGFQQVRGQVTSLGRSRKYLYLNFNRQFSVRITHKNWREYFHTAPETLLMKSVIVRGWVSKQGKSKLGMRIAHPAMIEIDNKQKTGKYQYHYG